MACGCLPCVSSKQAFAIPEASANAHTSIATNVVLRLVRWFEKGFMFMRFACNQMLRGLHNHDLIRIKC